MEISGLETFPTPVTISPAPTVAPERFGSTEYSVFHSLFDIQHSSENEQTGSGTGDPDSNVVETEAEFAKISGINEKASNRQQQVW